VQIEFNPIVSSCRTPRLDRGLKSGPSVLLSIVLKVSHSCDEALILRHLDPPAMLT